MLVMLKDMVEEDQSCLSVCLSVCLMRHSIWKTQFQYIERLSLTYTYTYTYERPYVPVDSA